ncbi:hypothetical protein GCM10010172_57460 [Paractinoplanes ferrugineus]|uniref:GGDEF domain-containing protein n=2 Tax=Paractinoplanes ferrugineus TaxID=113564 RepID=A0A919IZ38_9ACTN|nr:hypothetical protein Afe05nite_26240 [Actinoplanes ferrugineus]
MWLGIGGVATLAYALLPGGTRWHAGAYALIGVASIVVLVRAVRRHRPHHPSTWHAFAAAIAVWLAGAVLDRLAVEAPWTQVSMALALIGYPLACWALFSLLRGRARVDDRTALLDGGIIATGLGLVYWTVLRGDAFTIEVAFTVGDIALFVLVALLVTTPGAGTVSYRLMVSAMISMAVGDILLVSPQPPHGGGPADIALLASNTLVAAAAAHPSMRRLTVPLARPPRFVRPRLALLGTAILLPPGVSLYLGATGRIADEWLPTGIACALLLLLVTLRMAGLLHRVESESAWLERLANHDALTGLANRRRWDDRLPAAMARSEVSGTSLIVGLIDLDHFKRYNDTHGHQAGDELLSRAAVAWLMNLRDDDMLARLGGEEFAVLLAGHSMAEAAAVLERLMAATPQGQTFSAGLAAWDGRESPEDLLRRADELMYAAKRAGRARITTKQGVSLV